MLLELLYPYMQAPETVDNWSEIGLTLESLAFCSVKLQSSAGLQSFAWC